MWNCYPRLIFFILSHLLLWTACIASIKLKIVLLSLKHVVYISEWLKTPKTCNNYKGFFPFKKKKKKRGRAFCTWLNYILPRRKAGARVVNDWSLRYQSVLGKQALTSGSLWWAIRDWESSSLKDNTQSYSQSCFSWILLHTLCFLRRYMFMLVLYLG